MVGNWLWSVAKDLLVTRRREEWPDFELRDPSGERLFVEVKAKAPSDSVLQLMAQKLHSLSDPSIRFVLVTSDAPSQCERERFTLAFEASPSRVQWLTVQDLPALLGKPSPGPWNSPQTWSALQTSALVKGLEAYRSAPIGADPYATSKPTGELESLTRQFSYEVIARLTELPGELESNLRLGTQCGDVTIVLSDLVNFSSLVAASRPDDLKEAMGQYYHQVRQAVFDNGGMLDKFIGDAVLAVFGYPRPTREAPCSAIRFAQTLGAIGRNVMADWQAELNAVIDTGTRVGIATGDIWPINIGRSGIEIALLGDTINLAARLEKNCEVDKLLLDNRTHTAGQRADAAFIESLSLQQVVIPAVDAKGQAFPIRAWAQP